MRKISLLTPLFFVLLIPIAKAEEVEQIEAMINSKQGPAGVVFEIVGGDANSLKAAIIRIESYIEKIKFQFPATKFIVISHGVEQFSLLTENEIEHPKLHKQIQRLVKDDQIPLQVCGSFAGMMDIEDKEFQSFIEVVDSAPAQIEYYKYKGYRVIEMELDITD